jgi:hypothetical protein
MRMQLWNMLEKGPVISTPSSIRNKAGCEG